MANSEKLTWEPASALPQSLIDEFENESSNYKEITTITDTSYGAINHTLVVSEPESMNPPPTKSPKLEYVTIMIV